ncbi:hypothetical protein [Niallia sp.]|uniref:hypothetical protein n=1 Tax=Niallia sp. TaxID=2837523 RepID=UPI0028A0B42D|nr:hypothetical protein [Niallia sp.]
MNKVISILLFAIFCALIFIGIEIHNLSNDLSLYLNEINDNLRRLPENLQN